MSQQKMMAVSGYSLKTVRRALRQQPYQGNLSLLEVIVNDWHDDSHFPNRLKITGAEYPTFEQLCDQYGREFTAPSLLESLLESGLVIVKDGWVELTSRHVISKATPERMRSATLSLKALLSTLRHNLSDEMSAHIEQRWWSYRIPSNQLNELQRKIRELTEIFRDQVLSELEKTEIPVNEAHEESLSEAGVGLYWFERER